MAAIASPVLPRELESIVRDVSNARVEHDQQWILALIQKQGKLVVGLLWKMLGSEQDALDAYQSTICRLISQGHEAIGTNRAGYFYKSAMNAGIEMLRMRQRRQRHWPAVAEFCRLRREEDQPACDLDEVEDFDRLRDAISQLPPHLRDVIVLREMAGLPYRQLADILQIGSATARLYRHQAVSKLAGLLNR
jgi:RNA polymerase sigma-70 factor (ECF subfamily)